MKLTKISLVLTLFLGLEGCTYHTKNFVSDIKIEGDSVEVVGGTDYYFYIHDDPPIQLNLGCSKKTIIGESYSFLFPLPVNDLKKPHASLEDERFHLSFLYGFDLESRTRVNHIDLKQISVMLNDDNKLYPLRYTEKLRSEYVYTSELLCKNIKGSLLVINIRGQAEKNYELEFFEDIEHDYGIFKPFYH